MIFANHALLDLGWVQNIRLTLAEGHILTLTKGATPEPGDVRVDALLPALANVHSHSFQRAMAGMTEFRAAGRDSFWTWREVMYRFLDHLTPDNIETIAALAFMEMLEAGFAAVGEFHYVHHQPGGRPYDRPAELSTRIFAAAEETGIGLTHLPVLYSYGGAGRQPLAGGQLRFGNSLGGFENFIEDVRAAATRLPKDTKIGIAPHSLRALAPEDFARLLPLASTGPIHIHIAEQPKEVADISAWLGARPVEWLLANAPVDHRWCAMHATHMTAGESHDLAKSGAVAGLCPITEANLGDGTFNAPAWLAAGGVFGIGSDSNVRISLVEELCTLEYTQRLRDGGRNIAILDEGSVGDFLYRAAARGGAKALQRPAGTIAVGQLADLVAIDTNHPTLCALRADQWLDGWIFASSEGVITDVWSAGRHNVSGGRHIARERIVSRWRRSARKFAAQL